MPNTLIRERERVQGLLLIQMHIQAPQKSAQIGLMAGNEHQQCDAHQNLPRKHMKIPLKSHTEQTEKLMLIDTDGAGASKTSKEGA